MRFDWPPQRQGSTLQLEHQVQEKNWSGYLQNANFETFCKKGKERIQRRMHRRRLRQEEEQIGLNVVALRVCSPDNSADETTRMSTRWRLQIDGHPVCSCRSSLRSHHQTPNQSNRASAKPGFKEANAAHGNHRFAATIDGRRMSVFLSFLNY